MLCSGAPISSVPISASKSTAAVHAAGTVPCPYIPKRNNEQQEAFSRSSGLAAVVLHSRDSTTNIRRPASVAQLTARDAISSSLALRAATASSSSSSRARSNAAPTRTISDQLLSQKNNAGDHESLRSDNSIETSSRTSDNDHTTLRQDECR